MAEVHNEIQERESSKNNVINLEAEREKRLWRKSRGFKEPPKHIKITTAFLNRYSPEQTLAIDPTHVNGREIQREKAASEIPPYDEHSTVAPQNNDIAMASIRRKLRLAQQEQFGDRRKWQEIAKENGWGTNPDWPDDAYYVDRIVECSKRLGINPLTLSPEERKKLTTHGTFIIERARELGVNPLTLTPEDRQDLARMGRILTPAERREHAEVVAKYSVDPLNPEQMERWLNQYVGQMRNGQGLQTLGEVIERMHEMIGKGIKVIIPPPKVKH